MGIPPRFEGRCSRGAAFELELGLGKTVERVPRGVRWRMRRARMAESWAEGIESVERAFWQVGLVKMCCGCKGKGRRELAARGRRVRIWEKCILFILDLWM